MIKAEFLSALAEVLETAPDKLSTSIDLTGFECWDSTAVINLLVVFDGHGIKV